MSYSFVPPATPPAQVPTLVAANRLEGRPRSPEFNRALRAEVRDPTWLLARQWQLREFRAEDRGSPAYAELTLRAQPLRGLALPGQPEARPYAAAHQPLEAAVEAQPRPLGPGLRLQMGQYWLRLLATVPGVTALTPTDRGEVLGQFATYYPLTAPTTDDPVAYAQAGTTPEVAALLAIAGLLALDGYQLYQALLATRPAPLGAALADSDLLAATLAGSTLGADLLQSYRTGLGNQLVEVAGAGPLNAAARQFVLTFHRLYLLGQDSASWSNERLAYAFTVEAGGTTGLGSDHYPGGATLPWYAVDAQAVPAGLPAAPAVGAVTQRRLATGVQFPGAPAARWWEFEDRRVDFGQLTGDPSDWGRMLLQEFVFLYQNDWFSVPYTLDAGVLCAVDGVRVRDVFGRTYALQAAGAGQLPDPDRLNQLLDNDANRWRLFAQTDSGQLTGPAASPQLYLPATVLRPLVGRPVEQVSFRREAATNLVWAVENVISDGFAGGVDGAAAAAATTEALRGLAAQPTTSADPAAGPTYTYQLAGNVPENWVPFVPAADATGRPSLAQGALPRQVAGLPNLPAVQPRTTLLQGELNQPYYLHAHEVLPTGTAIQGLSYRARWYGGRTVSWFGRQRGPAQLSGSSGLVFDQLKANSY